MKNIILFIGLFTSLNLLSQSKTASTATFIVKGNCDQCKERIENAADIKGVKICTWDEKKKIASVTYDASKTNLETIQKAIAAAGYDAGDQKGNDAKYKKLPKCCQYRDNKCDEKK